MTSVVVDMNIGSSRSEKPAVPERLPTLKMKDSDLNKMRKEREHDVVDRRAMSTLGETVTTRATLTAKLAKFYLKDKHNKDSPENGFDEEEAGNVIEDDDLSSIDDNDRRYFPDNSTINHQTTGFSYHIKKIPPRRDIRWEVDSDDLRNINLLAEGSNSHVFTARWGKQEVIVKMIQFEKADHRMAHLEFDIECQALSRIDHPNIVRMLGCGSYPRPYVILERLKDISLMLDLRDSRTLFRKRVFNYPELLLIAIDLADAIDYLHNRIHPEMMIIHRDLKPENLGLTSDGKIKLIDFGLCRYVRKRTSLTETYKMTGNTGSIRYMAPEVVLEKPYTEKVDVFSFAVTIWAMGCNKLPYRELDRVSHKSRVVLNGERPKLDRSWPKEFGDLIKECWHQDFTKRPPFNEIKERLVAMSTELSATTAPPSAVTTARSVVGSQLSFVSRMFNRNMTVSGR